MKQERAEQFAEVYASGHARPEEVHRAQADLEIAQAHLLEAEEDLVLRQLEYEKIKTQVERRTIRAPISGVVSRIYKEQGEFVAPNDPSILTLVQLDPLLAVFSLTSEQAGMLRADQEVSVQVPGVTQMVPAIVEFIAPVTDAESGTILVKIRLDNSAGAYRSGTRCTLHLQAATEVAGQTASEAAEVSLP